MATDGRPSWGLRRASSRERLLNASFPRCFGIRKVCAVGDRPTATSVLPGTPGRRGRASRQRATCPRRPVSSEALRTKHGMRGSLQAGASLRRCAVQQSSPHAASQPWSPLGVSAAASPATLACTDPRVLGTRRRTLAHPPPVGGVRHGRGAHRSRDGSNRRGMRARVAWRRWERAPSAAGCFSGSGGRGGGSRALHLRGRSTNPWSTAWKLGRASCLRAWRRAQRSA